MHRALKLAHHKISFKLQYKKGEIHNLTLSKDWSRIRKALYMQLAMHEIKWGKISS